MGTLCTGGAYLDKYPLSLMLPRRSGASRIFLWQLLHFRPLNKYVGALGLDVTVQSTVIANRDKLLSGLSPMWRISL